MYFHLVQKAKIMIKRIKWWLVPVMVMIGYLEGRAADVASASDLQAILGEHASVSGNTVTLNGDVTINQSITITGGSITLNLNGYTLISDQTGAASTALGILVNGATANVLITGNLSLNSTVGKIEVRAAKGEKKAFGNGGPGYTAVGVQYNLGTLNIQNIQLNMKPGEGGDKGIAGSKGPYGNAYPIDPEGSYTVNDMVPAGWYIPEASENDYINIGNGPSQEKTTSYSVSVKSITYNATFNPSSGTLIPENPLTFSYTVGTQNVSLPSVSKTGYTFDGWTCNGSKVDPSHLPTTKDRKATVNVTFNADLSPIEYNIEYDLKGGTNPAETKSTYTIEDKVDLPIPTRSIYIFDGWFLTPDYSGEKQTIIPTGSMEDKKFYAKWYQYTISYDVGENGKMPDSYPKVYSLGDIFDLPKPTSSDTKKEFVAWFDNIGYTGTPYYSVKGLTGNKTFYAKWLTAMSITYHLNGGTNPKDTPITFTVESKDVILPTPTRDGYTFSGWFDDNIFSGLKKEKIPTGTDKNQTFYAKWTPTIYKITYNLNGGTNPDGIKQTYTIEDNDIKLPSPTRDGGTFAGWFTDSNFSQSITTISKGTTGDKTLYAKWNLTTYTIKLDTKGGSSLGDISYTIDTDNMALSTKVRKEGYTFAGWYKDEGYTQPFGETISKGTSGNFTLYAKWNPVNYTIKYETYSDVEVASSTYTIEKEVTLPVPQRSAYSFAGWYESDRLEGKSIMAIAKGTIGNKTLYAKWSAGSVVTISQGANGTFTVKNGDKEIKSGEYVGPKTELILTATPVAPYTLSKWVVNGKDVIGNPAKVEMPATNGLAVSAVFVDNRTAVSAPEIITTPTNTDKVPKGESVKVRLSKTDESAALYYSVDGAPEKAYNGEFLVSSAKDTLVIKAIARKTGFKDGVTTRQVVFDNNKITLTFDLPLGVKATNPTGGDVVTATTTGGSFEFKLTVDKNYYTNLDSMVVSANDSTITGNASGLYTLTNCSSDITVTVSGLKAKTCTVTLQQTENGQIKFTDGADETTSEVEYGSSVSITAVADEDFKFLQWNTGSQSNPLNLTVSRDTTISARFISDYKSYMMTLPQMEGVTVKPFSGYSTEVKKDGTFKFYLVLAKGYREGNLVVRANGEELTKNKGGYAIYHINKNISISVDGIVRDSIKLTLPDHVTAKVVETMSDVAGQGLFEETMLLLQAKAPEGKIFSKWTDGKTDNPRMATAVDAAQLIPLFTDKEDAAYAKVILQQSPGAGITGANSNMDAVKRGDVVQLKVVLLPAYSQSEVVLTADDKVLTPETSLRAASETKTYVYNLPVEKDGITVKVSGLKLNNYEVTVSQTNGGMVSAVPVGKVTHGDKVQLKAEAASGMLFVKWWDGNTLNPYPYTVTSDTEVKACFVGTESTVDNEFIRKDDEVSVSVTGRVLSVTVAEKSELYIWDYKGSLFRNQAIPVGEYEMSLPSGVYLVKVGDMGTRKIIIR